MDYEKTKMSKSEVLNLAFDAQFPYYNAPTAKLLKDLSKNLTKQESQTLGILCLLIKDDTVENIAKLDCVKIVFE